jgi:hypothetical protein
MKRTAVLIGTLLIAACGGGGGGGESSVEVKGSFVASEVEGMEVCIAGTSRCTYTDRDGRFSLTADSESPLLYFYAGGVKVGEYRLKENGEVINPFKLTETLQAGEVLAKTIHAMGGSTSGATPEISLSGITVKVEPEVDSLAEAIEEGIELRLEVAREGREVYEVRVEPQSREVELCTGDGCQEVSYREWLVLIYMDGDNNLSDYVDRDIEELSRVRYLPAVKVVALADYYGGDGGVVIESSEKSGELIGRNIPEPDMGSEETLKRFIKENMDRYPATKTALIFWNHGDGWRAPFKMAASDEWQSSYLWMYRVVNTLAELSEEGYRIGLIGFDECLMGMAEVFYDVGPFAEAVVASETYESGNGWDYQRIMEELNRAPQMDAYRLGKTIVDVYAESYRDAKDAVLTLLSKEEIEKLTEEINALAGELSEESYEDFKKAREGAVEVPDTHYLDLYSLVEELPFESAEKIKELIERAYKFSSSPEMFRGISIYFPAEKNSDPNYPCYLKEAPGGNVICYQDPDYYNPFAVNRWDEFLESYYSMEEE